VNAPVPYRVTRRHVENDDTATLQLEPAGGALPVFLPGQFAMVYAFGVGDIPLSVADYDGRRLTHTVRAVGPVSRAVHDARPGTTLGVRGPFGTPWGLPEAIGHDLVVLAGGIGLAPLRPLVKAVLAAPDRYGRLNLLAGARTPADVLYRDEIPAWPATYTGVIVDQPAPGWRGPVGVVTSLLDRAEFDPSRTTAFVCGPEVMIRAAVRNLRNRGVPARRVRVSLERTMHCGTGHCGHCQLGPLLLCRDGPVVRADHAEPLLTVAEM
jgi:NAD(P)H-flavin reductase